MNHHPTIGNVQVRKCETLRCENPMVPPHFPESLTWMISALRQSVGETPIPHLGAKCSFGKFRCWMVWRLLEGDTPEIRKNFLFNLLYHFFCWNDIGTFLRIDWKISWMKMMCKVPLPVFIFHRVFLCHFFHLSLSSKRLGDREVSNIHSVTTILRETKATMEVFLPTFWSSQRFEFWDSLER